MVLSFGIRLVILLPTFLFFIGFIFKALVEKKSIKELEEIIYKKIENIEMVYSFRKHYNDFSVLLAIDSFFILIANGLIIIFELSNNELGILLTIFGFIFSIYIFVCIYTKNGTRIGRLGIFGLLGGEFFYFLFYDIEFSFIQYNYFILTSSIIGIALGMGIGHLIFEKIYEQSLDALESYADELMKKITQQKSPSKK